MRISGLDDSAWGSPWRAIPVGQKVGLSLLLVLTALLAHPWPTAVLVAGLAIAARARARRPAPRVVAARPAPAPPRPAAPRGPPRPSPSPGFRPAWWSPP